MEQKAREEAEKMKELDGKFGEFYFISCAWFKLWKLFVNGIREKPGIINVKSLIGKNGKLREKMSINLDYFVLNQKQWDYMKGIYGSDHELCARSRDIYSTQGENTGKDQIYSRETVVKKTVENLRRTIEYPKKLPEVLSKPNDSVKKIVENVKKPLDLTEPEKKNSNPVVIKSHYSQIMQRPQELVKSPIKSPDSAKFQSESLRIQSKSPIRSQEVHSRLSALSLTINPGNYLVFGLENPRFQCYLNTIVQCLFSFPEFISNLSSSQCREPLVSSIVHLKNLAETGKPVSAHDISSIFYRNFPSHKQHDAPEFFRVLLDRINTELGGGQRANIGKSPWELAKSKYSSIISDLFLGLLSSTVQCLQCSNKTYSFEPFITLILKVSNTIQNAISDFKSKERICKEYFCKNCQTKRDILKNYDFQTLPKALVLHLKRFKWEPSAKKIDTKCEYSERIRVSGENGEKADYLLVSVVVHSGSADGGHYYAYAKRENWYCFNDENVTKVNLTTVLKAQAYMLFYKQE